MSIGGNEACGSGGGGNDNNNVMMMVIRGYLVGADSAVWQMHPSSFIFADL